MALGLQAGLCLSPHAMQANAPSRESAADPTLYICETVEDLYSPRGRAMIARFCRDFLDENKLLPLELMSHAQHAHMITASEALFAGLIQRAAVAQAQNLHQGVRERASKITSLINQGVTQTEAFEKKLPQAAVDGALIAKLAESDSLYGERIAFCALARVLKGGRDWIEKTSRLLNLLGDPAEAQQAPPGLKQVDAALAEVLLSRTGIPDLFGRAANPRHRIGQMLALLDPQFTLPETDVSTEIVARLTAVMRKFPMPAMRDALVQMMRRLMESSVALVSDQPGEEFRATRELYGEIMRDQKMAAELGAAETIENRMKRLVTRENLARMIAGAYAGPKLMTGLMLYEQTIGDGARDILAKHIAYLLEYRDLDKEFTDPSATQAEKLEMAEALREAIRAAGFPEHRREKFTGLIDALAGRIKASEQRRSPRTMCGPEDHVVIEQLKVPLKNWSAIGLLFGPTSASFSAGQQIALMVRVVNPKIQLGFEAMAQVVRAGDDGMIAVKYQAKDRQIERQIAAYFDPVGAAKG